MIFLASQHFNGHEWAFLRDPFLRFKADLNIGSSFRTTSHTKDAGMLSCETLSKSLSTNLIHPLALFQLQAAPQLLL